jgi:hypothetical protein
VITDETLDSNYVRLIFGKMEAEAGNLLEQKIGEFLLEKMAKANSSSSSGTGSSNIERFLAKLKITEAELVPQLHLMKLKTLLVETPLVKSQLVKEFGRPRLDKDVLEAKARMRRLVGRRMFLELEMRLPWLLRLGSDFFFA